MIPFIRAFEEQYLSGLLHRTESEFAKAAHECLEQDDRFMAIQEQMPFGGFEEFFSFPRGILGFSYLQNPSGAEKAYKSAIRKLRKQLGGCEYGQWCSFQSAIQDAHMEAGQEIAYCSPQITWREEQERIREFLAETAVLVNVHCVLHEAYETNES